MRYIQITTPDTVANYLYDEIVTALKANKTATWLLSGGSCLPIEVAIAKSLSETNLPLENLRVTLTDERYGELGHSNENWWQLEQSSFSLPGAVTYRVLQSGLDREATAVRFDAKLREFFSESDRVLGLFGMGADGHTAGIKPRAFDMTTQDYAVSYSGTDFERITMTPAAIKKVDEAVLYAVGEAKHPALRQLLEQEIPVEDQPAQVLKYIASCTLFTDITLKEETL